MGKYIVLFEISYFAFLNPPSGTSLYYIALLSGSGQLTDCEVADHCIVQVLVGDHNKVTDHNIITLQLYTASSCDVGIEFATI